MLDINHKIKHVISSKLFTRRNFLRIITISPLFFLLKPYSYLYASGKKRKKLSLASRNLIKGKFEFFTQYQATIVEEVTSLIIPTDVDPGAREAGVVYELDHVVANSNKLKELYAKGIELLDYIAEKNYEKESLLDLSYNEKIKLLKMSDSGKVSYSYEKSFFIGYLDSHTVRHFFINTIKQQTYDVFYTSEIGCRVIGYQRPPQWSGHPDYDKCA